MYFLRKLWVKFFTLLFYLKQNKDGTFTKVTVFEGVFNASKLNIGELNKSGEVGCTDGSVQLLHVIPAGKREMSVSDWLNGFKAIPGERFE